MGLLSDRVKKGAKLLDEKAPGWYEKVNLSKLEMNSYHGCVVGQLGKAEFPSFIAGVAYNEYCRAVLNTDPDNENAAEYGFTIKYGEDFSYWAKLEKLWRTEIEKRRGVSQLESSQRTVTLEKADMQTVIKLVEAEINSIDRVLTESGVTGYGEDVLKDGMEILVRINTELSKAMA